MKKRIIYSTGTIVAGNLSDKLVLAAFYISVVFAILIAVLMIKLLSDVLNGEKKLDKEQFIRSKTAASIAGIIILICLQIILYNYVFIDFRDRINNTFSIGSTIFISYAYWSFSILIILVCTYSLLTKLFIKRGKQSYFTIITVSIISGLANSIMIFLINGVLSAGDMFKQMFFLCFLAAMIIHITTQRMMRTKLIKITNNLVYELRMTIARKILRSSYESFESIESGRIQATLNNDTEVISTIANIVTTTSTSIVTVICCFIYLGIISTYGMLFSTLIIFIMASVYYFTGKLSNKPWQQARDVQNSFFGFIDDIAGGFKELSINRQKSKEFEKDLNDTCVNYREKKGKASSVVADALVITQFIYYLGLALIVFIFPVLIKSMGSDDLRSYVFILLYMTGPIMASLNDISNIIQVKISWNRVNKFIEELGRLDNEETIHKEVSVTETSKHLNSIKLQLSDIFYQYKNKEDDNFSIGPINYTFNSGEIIFITGGNGSGKSTLAKILTGLYKPTSGSILVNGKEVLPEELSHYYSAIFSDFHLFKKLYGIDYEKRKEDINKYLRLLQLDNKITISDGMLSTIKLSTGQRKRVALMISFIEDKPIYLFDEWAADQDPEFRRIFYRELLPELRDRGKCIIAVTHDDRYFEEANKVIKMEFGKISD